MDHGGDSGATGRRARASLPAKASLPRLTNAVPRTRVFRILDRALASGAAWIAAPAGAGKTTAVASFLAARGRPAVWYDVDATDTDVANVFLYVARGVRAATRSWRRLPVFQVQHLGSLRAFARRFFEALFAALPARAVLVLDNCHTVADSAAWAEILEEAARAVPDGRALILVSRAQPPAGFLRQIVNDRLAVVSGNELRFTDDEAGTLARRRVPRLARAGRDEVARLCALADGWAAGLVLVLDHAARGERTTELAQHDERLFDYFSAEVLAELPAEEQRVLLALALLPCMTERMAGAVSGWPGAGALLADLHRRGLLVERLGTQPATYRYHPLFRAFLLSRERPAPDLLARAGAACVEGGFLDEGVELLARAGSLGEVARLILAHAPRLVAEGRYRTLGAWLGRLDEPTIAGEPWLRFWQATASAVADQAVSRAQFTQAFEAFRERGDAAGLYLSIAGTAQVIFVAEDFSLLDPWFARFEELRRNGPPPPSDDVEATVLASLLMAACYVRPSYPDAGNWAARALELEPTLADVGSQARLWSALMMFLSITGRLQAALNQLAIRRPEVGPGLDPLTRMLVTEGEIHYAMINWRQGLARFREALELARGEVLPLFEPAFLAGAAQNCAIGGDEAGAAELLRQASAGAAEAPSAHLVHGGLLEYAQATAAFARGDFREAVRWLELALARNVPVGMRWGEILARPLLAIALGALGRHQDADREAARMVGEVAPVGVAVLALDLFAAERGLREGAASAEAAAARALDAAPAYGSYAVLYLRGLPHVLGFGLRAPAHAPWLAAQIVEHRVRPWPAHLDLAAWPFTVRVRTLGGFALEGVAAARSRKVARAPLRLLKCLVAAGGKALPVAAACDALWPDDLPATARRNLDTTLHRLRKLVGEDVVRLADGALAIDRARCFVDAWAFAALASQAERASHRDGEQARALFDEARRLYRGPLLPGEDDVPFVAQEREALRRRFVELVLAFARAFEARDRPLAVTLYERALEVEEVAEPLSQALMRAYLAMGRLADVAREYRRCQLALGAQPAPETRALYDQSRKAPGAA
jgi:DNA-binding SARP family transcriptional activator